MRPIQFRGKGIETGLWHHGHYYAYMGHHYIMVDDVDFEVYPETVAEYTGLHDYMGNEVFEGDIIRFPRIAREAEVAYVLGEFVALDITNTKYSLTKSGDYVVVKNKFEK
jgi:hypothetical protein